MRESIMQRPPSGEGDEPHVQLRAWHRARPRYAQESQSGSHSPSSIRRGTLKPAQRSLPPLTIVFIERLKLSGFGPAPLSEESLPDRRAEVRSSDCSRRAAVRWPGAEAPRFAVGRVSVVGT